MIKTFLSKTVAKPFKSIGIFGRARFQILYFLYRITGWHIRHLEWDFVLPYLPKLHNDEQHVRVLDVGCARNLFCFEVYHRGYALAGIDLEEPVKGFPGAFHKTDIRDYEPKLLNDFVTCISVMEHIEGDRLKALNKMIDCLKVGGRLLLTIPTKEFAVGHPWEGFDYWEIFTACEKGTIIDYTEVAGQRCFVIERIA